MKPTALAGGGTLNWGAGNIDADPLFADPENDDYHLKSEASKTYFGEPICETIDAGDINGDGQVNRTDLEIMALHWTDEEPLPLP